MEEGDKERMWLKTSAGTVLIIDVRYEISYRDMAEVQNSATAFALTLNKWVDSIEKERVNEEESRGWSNRYTPVYETDDTS